MTYQQHLFEWVVVKQYAPGKWVILGEFKKKREAKRYCKIIKPLLDVRHFLRFGSSGRFVHLEVTLRHHLTQKGMAEYEEDLPMTYRQQLFDWIVVKQVSPCNWVILSQFRRRNDADSYHQMMRKLSPDPIEVVFRNCLTEFGL